MLERDLLRDELDQILRDKLDLAGKLSRVLAQVQDPAVRAQISEILAHSQRHVELTERLMELVSE
jgi:hypothetical protein